MADAKPITDMRGTIRQRIHLIGVLTRRTLNITPSSGQGEARGCPELFTFRQK